MVVSSGGRAYTDSLHNNLSCDQRLAFVREFTELRGLRYSGRSKLTKSGWTSFLVSYVLVTFELDF